MKVELRSLKFAALVFALLGTAAAAQQGPDRSKPPATAAVPSLKLPPIQKRALSNGLPVWIVEMHEVPLANLGLIVKAGASADPLGKFGLASFTAAMLDEGAGTRNALDLADAIDFLGATLSTSSAIDYSSIRLATPVSKLDEALPLMADVALRPAFDAKELERLRKERLTTLLQMRDDAGSLASAAFARLVYGPRHRYGSPTIGNDASNGEMSIADLRGFYTSYYQPQNAHLVVVGDVTPESVLPKLEKAFGSWKNGAAPVKPKVDTAPQHGTRTIYLIDKPGAPQSQIRIGLVGVPRSTPDFFAIDVMNTVLGGSFSSRLNQNLREEHGYSYGASSNFDMRLSAGPFVAGAGVQSDKTVESLQEFFKELDNIRKPISQDELTRAKNYDALGYPSGFESTAGMAGNLISLIIYGLPETFFNEYVPKILAVTQADTTRVAQQYILPDKFAAVVVGDLAKIEKGIRAANLGTVKVVTVDEVLK